MSFLNHAILTIGRGLAQAKPGRYDFTHIIGTVPPLQCVLLDSTTPKSWPFLFHPLPVQKNHRSTPGRK